MTLTKKSVSLFLVSFLTDEINHRGGFMKKVISVILVAVLFSAIGTSLASSVPRVVKQPTVIIEGCGFYVGTKYGYVWVSVGC